MNPHVNYDALAATYNQRFQKDEQRGVSTALFELAAEVNARRILEVGCGTGRWLRDFSSAGGPSAQIFGLDFSMGMLRQAQQREMSFNLTRGTAEHLPFPDGSFDLVYCVNALHHFFDPRYFIFEARRLLRPGGTLAVTSMDPHRGADTWYVYEFFEGTYETDVSRFPSWGTVLDWMIQAGFAQARLQTVEFIHGRLSGPNVFDDPFLQKNSCSQLALLSDAAYAAGLRRLRQAVEAALARGETPVFRSDIQLEMLSGS